MNRTQLHQRLGGSVSGADLSSTLDELEEDGLIRRLRDSSGPLGGRPSERIQLIAPEKSN